MIFQHTCPICGTHLDAEEEIARLRARIATLEAVPVVAPNTSPDNVHRLPAPRQRAARDVQPDYRTAAEVWLAGDVLCRPKKADYRKGESKPVEVVFADGETVRTSTYLDGQAGLNAAGQFARATRQNVQRVDAPLPWLALYDHVAAKVGCRIARADGESWRFEGPGDDSATDCYDSQAALREVCNRHDLDFFAEMDEARALCPEWVEATRAGAGTWVRDSRGTWRLVDIQNCPDIVSIYYASVQSVDSMADEYLQLAAE